jgi:phosphoribosylamine--glycine ligase
MKKYGVPTAEYGVFSDSAEALRYIDAIDAPMVVKADGLCAGKGVTVCETKEQATAAVKDAMEKRIFADAGKTVLIEECLKGREASVMFISDGETLLPLASSEDHKRIYDGDEGPNTGGMGAYSPAPAAEGEVFERTVKEVAVPLINGLKKEGLCYKGVLYAGIMITDEGPKVLEFNVRFGDPEAQAILPRLKNDLAEVMIRCVRGDLKGLSLEWDGRNCVCVVMASGGYPGTYEKGKRIEGIEDARSDPDIKVFQAGTKILREGGHSQLITSGGRVLAVSAMGDNLEDAISSAYLAAGKIYFDNVYYRKDIGKKALMYLR